MPVAKTTKTKKTPAKKKPTVKKAEETTKAETNKIQSVIRVVYPDAVSVYEYYSNMAIGDLKAYYTGWMDDNPIEITVGLTHANKLAYLPSVIDHFAKMLIPAKYIQAIWQYEDKSDEG